MKDVRMSVVGSWVVGGETREDRDHGRIVSVDGDAIVVAWSNGETTPCNLSAVEVFTDWASARTRHEALDSADLSELRKGG